VYGVPKISILCTLKQPTPLVPPYLNQLIVIHDYTALALINLTCFDYYRYPLHGHTKSNPFLCSVADPDPHRFTFTFFLVGWIRIQEGKKLPKKVKKFYFFKGWMKTSPVDLTSFMEVIDK
jgi:hypothetical protein